MADYIFKDSLASLVDELPTPHRINDSTAEEYDCVISIAGFEPRCVSAVSELKKRNWRARVCICVRYNNAAMSNANSVHFDELTDLMSEVCESGNTLILEHDDHGTAVGFGEQLIGMLKDADVDIESDHSKVAFDVSVGSSRLLLEGLHALMLTDVQLTVLYTEVASYRPSFEEYRISSENKRSKRIEPPEFLTLGVDRVELLKAIPGMCADARPSFLVAFPAFSYARISAVIDELSPSRVQWIFGIPHLVQNRWRIDAQRDFHRPLIEPSHRHCYVSTFDYRETLTVLDQIYRKRKEGFGIFVASLGSKMQKVGQVLFHILRPEAAAGVTARPVANPKIDVDLILKHGCLIRWHHRHQFLDFPQFPVVFRIRWPHDRAGTTPRKIHSVQTTPDAFRADPYRPLPGECLRKCRTRPSRLREAEVLRRVVHHPLNHFQQPLGD